MVTSLPRVPVVELAVAGDVQARVQGAVVLLDAGHAGLRSHGWSRGRVTSRGGSGRGTVAMLHRQLLLAGRHRGALAAAAGLLLVPGLVQLLAGPVLALVVAVLLGMRVGSSTAGSLLVVAGSGGLARSLPFSPARLVSLLLVVPGLVVLGWAAAAVVLVGLPVWAGVALGSAALAGLVRGARPADIAGVGPLVMTEAGPVPVGLVARVVRGPDVALLAVAPLLLQLGPVAATAVPLLLLAAVVHREGKGH